MILLLLLAGLVQAQDSCIKDNNPTIVTDQVENNTFYILSEVKTNIPINTIFDVLTDFDHHPDFIHSIKKVVEVRSMQITPDYVVKEIDEEMSTWVFIFHISTKVKLMVKEDLKNHKIEFEDIGHSDFKIYKGSWSVATTLDGMQTVDYRMDMEPNFEVTPLVYHILSKRSKKLVDEVQDEMVRRCQAK